MGAEAEIILIGPYHQSIAKYLDYPEEWYKDVFIGTEVITSLCHCATSQSSTELAWAVGLDGYSELGQSKIKPENIDYNKLKELEKYHKISEGETESLKQLIKNGFKAYYKPNC